MTDAHGSAPPKLHGKYMFAALSPRLRNAAAARVVEKGQILEAFGE